MKLKTLFLLAAVGLLLGSSRWRVQSDAGSPFVADVWLAGADFAAGSGSGYVVTPDGLTLAQTAVSATYLSPILDAPIPFSAVVPQWQSTSEDAHGLELQLRTADAAGAWTGWVDVHAQDDWMLPGEPDVVGDMVVVPDTRRTHARLQVRVQLASAAGGAPVLQSLRLTVIDSTDGPTTADLLAQQAALDAAQGAAESATGYPKPAVISREVWCTDPECVYSGMTYYPVTHLIVHHTVSNNDYTDSAVVVRAIWRFHTFTRGWGDVGYNYLVDLNGVLFEGHRGGDDVVGTHASGANRGSMALALIGTFTQANGSPPGIAPPQAMLNSAADLLAWKADQKGIDVFDASDTLPDIAWGLPNLMGHRDVYGGPATQCPGDQAYAALPALRQMVASRIGFVDNRIYVDELSGQFTKSNANWYVGPRGCGHNGHSYYTFSTTDPGQSSNWGEWRPVVPATGRYAIDVYAPYCDTNSRDTSQAPYTIQHLHGTSSVIVNQDDRIGLWTSLGEYDLAAGTGNLIRLTDLTPGDSNGSMWFDAIRLRPIEGVALLAAPAQDSWVSSRTVDFNWSLTNPGMVAQTTLQVATDPGFTAVLLQQTWGTAVTSHSHTFGQDYANLYWRVKLTSTLGNVTTSAVGHFGLDATPPQSAVTVIYRTQGSMLHTIVWSGSDALSGIARYDVEYRLEGSSSWQPLLTNTTRTVAQFTPAVPGQIIWFRSQAADRAGNVEPPNANGDMSSAQAIVLTHAIMLPVIK